METKYSTSPLVPIVDGLIESKTFTIDWLWFRKRFTREYYPIRKLPYATEISGTTKGREEYEVMKHYAPRSDWPMSLPELYPFTLIKEEKKSWWKRLWEALHDLPEPQ